MSVHTAAKLVERCENQLGWTAPPGMALWKARRIEIAKLNRAMEKAGVSLEDVAYALELSRREHATIESPAALVWRVERAREVAVATEPVGLDQQIRDAIDFELDQELPDHDLWVSRLSRCSGPARAEVLDEWLTTRTVAA